MERRIQGSETPECHSDEVRKHRGHSEFDRFPRRKEDELRWGRGFTQDRGKESQDSGVPVGTAESPSGEQQGAHSLAPEGIAQEIGPYNPLVCAEWALCFCRLATTVPKQILLLNQIGICLGVSGFGIEQLKSRTWPDSSWATPTASVSWGILAHSVYTKPGGSPGLNLPSPPALKEANCFSPRRVFYVV